LVPYVGTLAGGGRLSLGISAFALMAFGFSRASPALRAVAGCQASRILTTVLLFAGLIALAARV
jgi:hypothetical protein